LCSCLHESFSFFSWSSSRSRSAHFVCAMTYLSKVIKDERSTDKSHRWLENSCN
jgi:hypothetical protein